MLKDNQHTSSVMGMSATGEEISKIVDMIENAVEGERESHVIIAALALAIVKQKPEIDSDELQGVILDVSRYIVMALGGDAGVEGN